MERALPYLGLWLFNIAVLWIFHSITIMFITLVVTHFFIFLYIQLTSPPEEFRKYVKIAKENNLDEVLKGGGRSGHGMFFN